MGWDFADMVPLNLDFSKKVRFRGANTVKFVVKEL